MGSDAERNIFYGTSTTTIGRVRRDV